MSLALYGFLDSHISIKVIKFKLEESALIGNFLETMLALFIQKLKQRKEQENIRCSNYQLDQIQLF